MGLFSGIGGFELAFSRHGGECVSLCDIDENARAVLRTHFNGVPISNDIRSLRSLKGADVLTAGFPCQDLSQAGGKHGITGTRSGLVDEVFRLIDEARRKPKWVILENVSYMLRLHEGRAVRYIIDRAEALGYHWAYRVLDARCFGLPQRRERVIMVLSRNEDPSGVLFPRGYVEPNFDDRVGPVDPGSIYGFYWTEGKRGLGWVKDAVPTIKGGSALGIASPPAVWNPATGDFGTPSIADAERLFGFEAGWTASADATSSKKGSRWKLVGNTLCVPMVDWVARQIASPQGLDAPVREIDATTRPPLAAYGYRGRRFQVNVSTWVEQAPPPALGRYLTEPLIPLSVRAAAGFYKRAQESTTIRFAEGFLDSVAAYIQRTKLLTA
ncbi:DNA cytosine methyltransferase [Achromobacter dolens]|uniref:DNA cytosine methyltransferase n=1 Tax=Achromobacter dolens TaxID=1287738 RepID=UPI0009EC915E|nr:DNA (cytosine-5-)-methyltransferase [Achromobacter dolens]